MTRAASRELTAMLQTADRSRDLLFGLLALQNGMIDQGALFAAFAAWTRDKGRPLAEHLVGRGDLDAEQHGLLEGLVAQHLKKHGGSTENSLAAIPAGRSVREGLAQLGDPDITATLAPIMSRSVESHDVDDPDRTAAHAVGEAGSDGQRFRVLRPHARGGLGAVFVALDCELNREVAIKQILDHHAGDPNSRQRFLIEAQVTGGLEHPGIVPVYGLGTFVDGRPYYAMRLIKGDTLKEVIERFHADASLVEDPGRRSLELRKLLRRFVDVCNAIDYAHSRGVLHRDIKPGNIVVGKHGETLLVDWGLAKATGKSEPGAGERTLKPYSAGGSAETLPGSALGTPAFMSPEQAGGDLETVGPRSDVYNLGATLYCLLTGHPPYKGESGEVLRAVQRGDFRPPRAIDPSIDRALEAVCLKAMAFRPEDRYAQCRALTEDIERWMADEPVSAWREPIARRVQRWMRRNRPAVAAMVVALVASVIGTAVSGVQARAYTLLMKANDEMKAAFDKTKVAKRASEEALAETKEAKRATEEALAQAEENARRAEANAQTARRETQRADDNAGLILGAMGRLVQRVGGDPRLRAAGLTAFRQELLRDVVGMYDELASRNPGAGTLGLGQALNNQAMVQHLLGEFPQAIASQLRGEEVLAALPPTPEARLALADARKQLGVLYHFAGKPSEGLAKTRDAVALYQAVIRERPSDQNARFQLALATVNLGNFAMESEPETAIARYREALALIAALRSESPANPSYIQWEARTTSHLSMMLLEARKTEDAIAAHRQAVALAERVPDDFSRLDALAICRNNLAEALERARRPAEAETIFRQAVQDYRTLAGRFPNDMDYRWGVAMALTNLADVVLQQDRPRDARGPIEEASKIYDALEKPLGANPEFRQHHEKNKRVRDAIRQRLEAKRP